MTATKPKTKKKTAAPEVDDAYLDSSGMGDNILAAIRATAMQQIEAEAELAKAEDAAKAAKNKLRDISDIALPELMQKAGQLSLTTLDNIVVRINDELEGSIPKDPTVASQAYKFLEESGNGAIIKNALTIPLGKESEALVAKINKALKPLGIQPQLVQVVHHMTLKSVARELLADGKEVPLATLGLQAITRAKCTLKG